MFFDWSGLTSEHRLINLRRPLDDSAVGGDSGVRENFGNIAVLKKSGVNLTFRSALFVDEDSYRRLE